MVRVLSGTGFLLIAPLCTGAHRAGTYPVRMRIATVNVNGIRAAARKGMVAWLEASAPDVLLLQEVRADADTAAALLPGYRSLVWPSRIRGRAGVGVAVREEKIALSEVVDGIRSGAVGDPLAKKGRSFPIGTGWAGQIGTVTVVGENLERTLLLNAVVCEEIPDLVDVDPEEDLAPWEREPDGPARTPAREPLGPVDCYTWQTRRVLLHGDDDGVTGLFLGNGDKATPQNRYLVEPMTAWRYSEPQSKKLKAPVYMPRKLPTDRAFWRGLSTLVAQLSPPITVKGAGEVTPYRSPGVVDFYQDLMYHEIVPASGLILLHAVGIEYGSNESTIAELVDDVLSLPAGLLGQKNERLLAVVRGAMEETEKVANALWVLARDLDRARGGSPDTGKDAGRHAAAAFYQVIDERFPRWLTSLDQEDPDRAHARWRGLLRSEALEQQEALASAVPDTAFAGRGEGKNRKDVGRALLFFRRALARALPLPQHNAPAEDAERTPA